MNTAVVQKVSTGIKELDRLIDGGIPLRCNMLLIGPPQVGKRVFGMEFVASDLGKDAGILISTTETAEGIKQRMNSLGLRIEDSEENGLLKFVDCYSKMIGISCQDTLSTSRVGSVLDLSGIAVSVSKMLSTLWRTGRKIKVVFDSVSSLLMYSNVSSVIRFLHVFYGRLKVAEAVGFFLLEEGMHDENVVAALEHLSDGVIKLERDRSGKYRTIEIRGVVNYKDENLYEITDSGIVRVSGSVQKRQGVVSSDEK